MIPLTVRDLLKASNGADDVCEIDGVPVDQVWKYKDIYGAKIAHFEGGGDTEFSHYLHTNYVIRLLLLVEYLSSKSSLPELSSTLMTQQEVSKLPITRDKITPLLLTLILSKEKC